MTRPLYGQIAVSGSAQALSGTATEVQAFTIKASRANANPVFLGDQNVTTSTGHQLDPGDQFEYERSQQNGQPVYQLKPADFFVVGTSPDRVSWLASP